MLTNALPMPGAMLNHFVIANWYNTDNEYQIGNSNTQVKIMKYYPGVEVSGSVTMSDDGEPLPNVRVLIERDAFSGEDAEDRDEDTYWIPIGVTDADENGDWSFLAPAGRIRVSAFAGVFDDTFAIQDIQSGDYVSGFSDVLTDINDDREVYAITAVLGEVGARVMAATVPLPRQRRRLVVGRRLAGEEGDEVVDLVAARQLRGRRAHASQRLRIRHARWRDVSITFFIMWW